MLQTAKASNATFREVYKRDRSGCNTWHSCYL